MLVGLFGAVIGSIVSTRLMLMKTKKIFGTEAECDLIPSEVIGEREKDAAENKKKLGMRIMDCLMAGGSSGVKIGISIIPGVLIICTIVMMLTFGSSESGYVGAAYEGIGLIPYLANKIQFILKPLFGFASGEAIAVPITALGSAGAAIGLIPEMLATGAADAHDVAVFTAMCMCWSGYLSTHVSMMAALGRSDLSGKAIASHTVGGLVAGVAANWGFRLVALIFGF